MTPDSQDRASASSSTAVLRVVMIYAVFAGLWILLSDRLVGLVARNAQQMVVISTLKGWLFVGVTSLLLYRLIRGQLSPAAPSERRRRARRLLPPVLLLGVAILVLTTVGVRQAYRQQEVLEGARLQAIADLKARQLTDWVGERMGDAAFTATSQVWSKAYQAWVERGDLAERRHLLDRLESFRQVKGFVAIEVLDGQGAPVFTGTQAAPELREAVRAVSRTGQVRLVGPYRAAGGLQRLDFLAPLAPGGGLPRPVVVLSTDPATHVFPILQTWPVPSASGEVVLFRRQGDAVQYLSESRFPPGQLFGKVLRAGDRTYLSTRFLAGAAAPGTFMKGLDYRGAPVAGVASTIAGTDWHLIAKIDQAELEAGAQGQAVFIGLAGLLGLFLAAVAHHLFRQQRILVEAERERGLQAERLRALRLLDAIANGSSDAIFAKDRAGRYLLFNPEAERMFGRKAADLVGKDAFSALPDQEAAMLGAGEQEILQKGSTFTMEEVYGPRTFLVTKGPLRDAKGGIMGHYGIAKDITERKRAERSTTAQNSLLELVASGRPLQDLLDALTRTVKELAPGFMVGLLLCDEEGGHLVHASRAELPESFCQALDGVPLDASLGPCPMAALLRVPVVVEDILTETRFGPEFRALAASAGIRSTWSTPILDSVGAALGTLALHGREPLEPTPHLRSVLAMATHVASIALEGHREERALQESGQRFRQLFEAAPVPMCLLGEGDRILALNGQFLQTFGYRLEDIVTLEGWLSLAYPDPADRDLALRQWSNRPPAGGVHVPVETAITCADGARRTVLVSATAIGRESVVTFSDITDRVKAEEERQALQAEVQQAQKMDSIGRLAGGVAHDFNNMLGVIVANAEIGLLGNADAGALARFEEIRKAALRSADLTRQLLAFARRQTVSPRILNLNDAIPGILQMLSRLIGENIRLDYTQRTGLWRIRMDPTQVDQILTNLAVNARDAIDGVGSMGINTRNVEILEAEAQHIPHRRPGQFVLLEVADTGCGMGPEQLKHIFEPFFTTKGVGKGTGLGLATVYGIVKQNGGFIEVDSAPGRGTTFRVHLPRFEGAPEDQPEALKPAASTGGRERILVVEDEPLNLDVTVMLLERLGYGVLAAATPSEALRLLGDPGQDLQLLFTDIIMPEMNGRELLDRARAIRPGLKCLFMSGYTADIIAHHGAAVEVKLLGKPFTLEELAAGVREVLDS